MNGKKIGAVGCCVAFLLSVLLLPMLSTFGYNVSGMDVMPYSGWPVLPLVAGIIMGVCAVLLPGTIGAIVSLVGSFFPLLAFFLIRTDISSLSSAALFLMGIGSSTGVITLASALIHVGLGCILAMFFGFGSALLCYLSEKSYTRTPPDAGLTSDGGNEW